MADELLSGRRVLVVEDEMLLVMLIEDMMADFGCTALSSAASVEQALSLIATQRFDVAMLDVNLNGSDSRPVAEALSARGVPFFYATGNADHGLRDGYADRPVLRKPFSQEDLIAILGLIQGEGPASTR